MIIPLPADKRTLRKRETQRRNIGPQNKTKIQSRADSKIQQRDDSTTPAMSSSGGGGLDSGAGAGIAITFGVAIVVILTIVIIRYSIKRKSQKPPDTTEQPNSRRGHQRQHSDNQMLLAAGHSIETASSPRTDEPRSSSREPPVPDSPLEEQTSADLPPRYDQVVRAPPPAHQIGRGSTASSENERGRRSGAWRVSVIEGKTRSSR